MKSIFKYRSYLFYLLLIWASTSITSCRPEKFNEGNGLSTVLQPSFTITPVQGRSNTYLIKNTTAGAISTRWDFDKGTGYAMGKTADTVFYADAGTYTVKMQATGIGGVFYDAAPQTVSVTTSDPVAGNLVQGGKMNSEDDARWARLTISPGVTFALSNGRMIATGGNGGHEAIYQAIQVQANKKYKFAATVTGSGATNTWFDVYLGTTAPVQGSDYVSGGNRIGLDTRSGCGNATFNGNLATIGCTGSLAGKSGEITFTQSGTVYLVIKAGGANLGTGGIAIDNVELRGS